MACHITVLGDSSSSGIGLGRACYPSRLAGVLSGEIDVHVANTAVPGFTSADASRFFRSLPAELPLDYVIVYLGNNEGAVSQRKGYYSPLKAWVAGLGRSRERPFRPVLSPPRFRFDYGVRDQTVATSPTEFRGNLQSIVRLATRRGAKVILLNPVANPRFPCGAGAANATYFCHLDDLGRLGDAVANEPIDKESGALADGLRQFAEGEFAAAVGTWEPLASLQNVAGFIARHNIACARARLADDRAEQQLRALLGEHAAYDSTVLYNLAWLKRGQGDEGEAGRLLEAALEGDTSIYRIRNAYREVIAGFASTAGVRVLDLEPVLDPGDFVDYCHPTDEGHEKIARAVADLVKADDRPRGGAERSHYDLVLPSPDFVNQPGETIVDYYCIDWPLAENRIAAAVDAVRRGGQDVDAGEGDEIGRCIANFLRSNAQHPAFTEHLDLAGAWAPRSHEILSLPEQFLYRLLHNYSMAFEEKGLASRLSSGALLERERFSAADYERIILRSTRDDLGAELVTSPAYLDAVVRRTKSRMLSTESLYGVTLGERLRTVMTWFTREAFRYGTQSRMSMMYARWDIEKIVEGLIVAVVIADARGEERVLVELDGLLWLALDLMQVHERHVRLYHCGAASFSVEEYRADLAGVKGRVEACIHG